MDASSEHSGGDESLSEGSYVSSRMLNTLTTNRARCHLTHLVPTTSLESPLRMLRRNLERIPVRTPSLNGWRMPVSSKIRMATHPIGKHSYHIRNTPWNRQRTARAYPTADLYYQSVSRQASRLVATSSANLTSTEAVQSLKVLITGPVIEQKTGFANLEKAAKEAGTSTISNQSYFATRKRRALYIVAFGRTP